MAAAEFIEDSDRPQSGRGPQHLDDLIIPDIGERIGSASFSARLLLVGKPGILFNTIGGGRAESGLRAGERLRGKFKKNLILTIGDVSAGQNVGPLDREGRCLIQPPLPPDEATWALAAAAGISTVGLRPSFVIPAAAHSHPDCRAAGSSFSFRATDGERPVHRLKA